MDDKINKLKCLLTEDGQKFLHCAEEKNIPAILCEGLRVNCRPPQLSYTLTNINHWRTKGDPNFLYKYRKGDMLDPRNILVSVPSLFTLHYGKRYSFDYDYPNNIIHQGMLPPEFIRGIIDKSANFVPNTRFILSLKNTDEVLGYHKERMNSPDPWHYDKPRPELILDV